jgi:hypothetical protein
MQPARHFSGDAKHRDGDDGVAFRASLEREIFSFSSIILQDRHDRVSGGPRMS